MTTLRERGRLDVVMTMWLHDEEPPAGRYRAERDDGSSLELHHPGAPGRSPAYEQSPPAPRSELSEKSQAKARRLLDSDGVQEVTEARAFLVRGDHGTYTVTLAGGRVSCSCPAFGPCSHAAAARLAAAATAGEAPSPATSADTSPLQLDNPSRRTAATRDSSGPGGDDVRRVYTGRWHVVRDVPAGTIVPVRISVGAARFIPGARAFPAIEELVPHGLLDIEDTDEFRRQYRRRLENHGAARIWGRFDELHSRYPGLPLVLLCFEADRADCHRGDFADWYEEVTGVAIPELTLPPS